MNDERYEKLKLDNQLCFPLYACSKEIVRRYKPYLDELDLTYTQYITMMVMWECKEINVKSLGQKLYLDSGTLTPVLKKLEIKGYVTRNRCTDDERNLCVRITDEGMQLRGMAVTIPENMCKCIALTNQEMEIMHGLLLKMLEG